jgi:hypothetical protein
VAVVVGIYTVKNFHRMVHRTDPEVFTLVDSLSSEHIEELGSINLGCW